MRNGDYAPSRLEAQQDAGNKFGYFIMYIFLNYIKSIISNINMSRSNKWES